MALVRNIFRMMVVAFFSMTWVFLLIPLLNALGLRLDQTGQIISFIAVPLAGLITAQIILRNMRGGD